MAGGSGITPVLALVATALAVEPASTFTLLYGNRTASSVMFAEELADLKDRYPARLHLVHVLSREPGESPLLSGRLDGDRLTRLLAGLVPADGVDEWFLCGPYGMVTEAREVLAAHGVPEAAVHAELFHVEAAPPPQRAAEEVAAGGSDVTIVLEGRASTFTMGRDRAGARRRTQGPRRAAVRLQGRRLLDLSRQGRLRRGGDGAQLRPGTRRTRRRLRPDLPVQPPSPTRS